MTCNIQQITEVPPKSAAAPVALSVEDKLYLTVVFYQHKRLLYSTLTSSASGSQEKQAVCLGETLQGQSWGTRRRARGQG